MSHNVYKVAIQMARTVPSLKEETGVRAIIFYTDIHFFFRWMRRL